MLFDLVIQHLLPQVCMCGRDGRPAQSILYLVPKLLTVNHKLCGCFRDCMKILLGLSLDRARNGSRSKCTQTEEKESVSQGTQTGEHAQSKTTIGT